MDSIDPLLREYHVKKTLGTKLGATDDAHAIINKAEVVRNPSELGLPPPNTFFGPNETTRGHSPGPDHLSRSPLGATVIVDTAARSKPSAFTELWRNRARDAWLQNKGVAFMILAQFFGSAMAAIARLMETDARDRPPMSPFQILFARQVVTVLFSLLYMWWAKVPHAPLGPREVRPVLALRGFGGFFGVFGLYFSLVYLPLADAIVMTFLAPMLAAWICSFIIGTAFTRSQKIGGLLSVVGVVLITQPFSLFYHLTSSSNATTDPSSANTTLTQAPLSLTFILNTTAPSSIATPTVPQPTPAQRALAVLIGLIGVLGSATAYTTLSWIGKRAHPLISVNYFATWCTIIAALALLFVPSVPFRLPADVREWALLLCLGLSGFVMQFLLTASLAHGNGKSTRVLNVVYVQMVFALGFDRVIWGEVPGPWSWAGSGLILGSVIWVAVRKDSDQQLERKGEDQEQGPHVAEEELGLVEHVDAEDNSNDCREEEEEARFEPRAAEPSTRGGVVAMQEIRR